MRNPIRLHSKITVIMAKVAPISPYKKILTYAAKTGVGNRHLKSGEMEIFECNRIGFLIQGLIYFIVTAIVSVGITVLFWQLHHHPAALICTLLGYGVTYVIMGFVQYRRLKQDVQYINEELA